MRDISEPDGKKCPGNQRLTEVSVLNDGLKWIAVAMVLSSVIIYVGMTKSERDCVAAYTQSNLFQMDKDKAVVTCHGRGK